MHAIFQGYVRRKKMTQQLSHSNRFWRWGIFSAALLFYRRQCDRRPGPGGAGRDTGPATIPKYVTPLVIPPVMKNTGTAQRLRHRGAPVPAADPAGRHMEDVVNGRDRTCTSRRPRCGATALPLTRCPILGSGRRGRLAPAPNSQFNYPAYHRGEHHRTDDHGGLDQRPGVIRCL